MNATKQIPTTIQTLILSKERFETKAEANAWIRDNDFNIKSGAPDETEDSWRYRQREPSEFAEGSFRTIEITDGVKAVVGHLKEEKMKTREENRGTELLLPLGLEIGQVQELSFAMDKFRSAAAAKSWTKNHGFSSVESARQLRDAIVVRVRSEDDFESGTLRREKLTRDVIAMVGTPKVGSETEKVVPASDASRDEKREAQKARSEKWGIEALEGKGENLSFPAGGPTDENDYGDPCLPAYTLVYTQRGAIPISDVIPGDSIFSTVWENVISGEGRTKSQRFAARIERDSVQDVRVTGTKQVYEVRTSEGTVRATGNHRFLALVIPEGRGSREGRRLEFVRLDTLKIGDRIVLGNALPGNKKIDPRLCRLLGFYLGDGTFQNNSWNLVNGDVRSELSRLSFACSCEEEGEKYAQIIKDLFPEVERNVHLKARGKSDNDCWILDFTSSKAVRKLSEIFGDAVGKCYEKRIPSWVFELDQESALSLLEGYIDADGWRKGRMSSGKPIYRVCSVSPGLIQDIYALCRYVGWRTTNIYIRHVNFERVWPNGKIYQGRVGYDLVIYPESEYKNRSCGPSPVFTDDTHGIRVRRISSIEEVGEEEVWDLQTEKTGNFLAQGYVVHNCNLKYPVHTVENARNARVRFKQNADVYEKEKSKRIVHERIVRAELKLGIEPSFDPDDPLDALLPGDLKDQLSKRAKSESEPVEFAKRGDLLIRKAEEGEDPEKVVRMFGIVMKPEVPDCEGDVTSAEEIERACFEFMKEFQTLGFMHKKDVSDRVKIIQNVLAPTDFDFPLPDGGTKKIAKGTWYQELFSDDEEIVSRVRKKQLNGLSIGGFARREPVTELMKVKILSGPLTPEQKREIEDAVNKRSVSKAEGDPALNRFLDLRVEEVSLVDAAANEEEFFIVKNRKDVRMGKEKETKIIDATKSQNSSKPTNDANSSTDSTLAQQVLGRLDAIEAKLEKEADVKDPKEGTSSKDIVIDPVTKGFDEVRTRLDAIDRRLDEQAGKIAEFGTVHAAAKGESVPDTTARAEDGKNEEPNSKWAGSAVHDVFGKFRRRTA